MPGITAPATGRNLPVITVSDILPFLDCNYKGAARYSSQRWTSPTRPMERGTALHEYVRKLFETGKPDHRFLDEVVPADVRDEVEPLITAADRHLLPIPFHILGIEQSIQLLINFEHYDFYLHVRPDFIVNIDGKVWSGQIKTLGRGIPLGPYLEKVRMSFHEGAYRTALRTIGHDVAGTILLTFRTYLTKEQKANNVPVFEQFVLPATEEEDNLIFTDLRRASIALFYYTNTTAKTPGALRTTYAPIRGWHNCTSLLGTCPLYQHCHNRATIEDCLPVPLTDRYPEFTPAVAPAPPPPQSGPTASAFAEMINNVYRTGLPADPPRRRR
jgi:hypothetical protein